MEMAQSTTVDKFSNETKHHLSDKWVLWAHLPHDTDWTLKSYINIVEFETVEEVIAVINTIPQTMIKNCMLFVMKEGINPTWEDKRNSKGGCFSFKIMNKQVCNVWNDLQLFFLHGGLDEGCIRRTFGYVSVFRVSFNSISGRCVDHTLCIDCF